MNQAYNLPLDELIKVLQTYRINGAKFIDITIHSPFDVGIRESEYQEGEPKIISLKGIDPLSLT